MLVGQTVLNYELHAKWLDNKPEWNVLDEDAELCVTKRKVVKN